MTLLEVLKSMKELEWEFEVSLKLGQSHIAGEHTTETRFKIYGELQTYRIPTIQEVEDAVVEMMEQIKIADNSDVYFGIRLYLNKWRYSLEELCAGETMRTIVESYDPDRLIAVCQLWVKLREGK